jgi:hypothetical protein
MPARSNTSRPRSEPSSTPRTILVGHSFLGADPGLGLALGLAAIPKATHLTSYSYRVKRSSNVALLEGLARRCRQIGLYSGEAGFNLDFHSIRHHGAEVPLEEQYVASRSQRTRSVLTFFPRPRLDRDGLRQRRCDQGRPGR